MGCARKRGGAGAAQALEHLYECAVLPDLILLDAYFQPAAMTGFDLCSVLRTSGLPKEKLAVLIMSSRSSSAHVQETFQCGANDCVQKPATAAEIVARIHQILNLAEPVVEETSRKRKNNTWWLS